jgi:hypothetical protein
MIFRNITESGDWTFGASKQNYARDDKALGLSIATKLKTFLSECFFNTAVGLPWFDLINTKNKDIIVLYVKSEIAAISGVLKVNEIEYNISTDRKLSIRYSINTLYGINLIGVVEI